MMTEALGWAAALILLITMARQVWKQWTSGAVAGVSRWLFVGQLLASAGFCVYSGLVGNAVFVFTNLLMLLNALLGLWVDKRNRQRRGPNADAVPV